MVVGATKDIAQPLAQSNGRCRGAQPWPFDTWQMRVDDGNHACGASNVPPLRVSALVISAAIWHSAGLGLLVLSKLPYWEF